MSVETRGLEMTDRLRGGNRRGLAEVWGDWQGRNRPWTSIGATGRDLRRHAIGDDAGRLHRGLAELRIAGDLALDALALAVQQIAQAFQFAQQHDVQGGSLRPRGLGDVLPASLRSFAIAATRVQGTISSCITQK